MERQQIVYLGGGNLLPHLPPLIIVSLASYSFRHPRGRSRHDPWSVRPLWVCVMVLPDHQGTVVQRQAECLAQRVLGFWVGLARVLTLVPQCLW